MKDDIQHLSYTHYENLLNPFGLICTVLQATGTILWGCCVTQVLKWLSSYQKTVLVTSLKSDLHFCIHPHLTRGERLIRVLSSLSPAVLIPGA